MFKLSTVRKFCLLKTCLCSESDAQLVKHDSHSDSEYEDVRSDLVRCVLDWKNVQLKMQSNDEQIVSGILRLREDWNNLFESRLQPKKYKPKEADELIISTLKDILIKEGT